jgi:hypothetical protein
MPTEHRSTAWVWMIPLLLFATWLGGRSLNTYLPWVDEMISLEASGSVPYGPISPGDIVNRVNASCCWPPGHDFLLAGWNSIAGHGVFTGRTLSLLIGLLAIALTYRLGRDIATPLAGLGAATVIGTSIFFIYYTTELRGYTLYVMFTVLCLDVYWWLLNKRNRSGLALLFVFSLAGLAYTHYAAVLVAIPLGLYHLFCVPKTKRWWVISGLMVASFILFVPWIAVSLVLPQSTVTIGQKLPLNDAFASIIQGVSNNIPFFLGAMVSLALLAARGKGATFIRFWALAVIGIILVMYQYPNFLQTPRHIIVMVPLLSLLVGLGLGALARFSIVSYALLVLWAAIGIGYNLEPQGYVRSLPGIEHRVDSREFMIAWKTIQSCAQPEDTAVFHVEYRDWEWLYAIVLNYYKQISPLAARSTMLYPQRPPTDEDARTEVLKLIENTPHVWTVFEYQFAWEPRVKALQDALSQNYTCQGMIQGANLPLRLYTRKDQPPLDCHVKLRSCSGKN